MAGYLRTYIPHFSALAEPLTRLTKKAVPFQWTRREQQAFEDLKRELTHTVTLAFPRGSGNFVLFTDASDTGIGVVLCQRQEGEVRLLEFASAKLTETQRNWPTTDREGWAIVWALRKYRDLLLASKVEVYSDHSALQWLLKAESGRRQRWALELQGLDLEIHHISGETNAAADLLSRWRSEDEEIDIPDMWLPVGGADIVAPTTASRMAPKVPTVEDFLLSEGSIPAQDQAEIAKGKDGLHYGIKNQLLYVPPPLRDELLSWFHLGCYGGHSGVGRMRRRMQRFVWWPTLRQDLAQYVRSCAFCRRRGPPLVRPLRGALGRPRPMELISLDHVGPRVFRGLKYWLLVTIDHSTRFIRLDRMMEPPTAEVTRRLFLEGWLSTHAVPRAVLTDNGSPFRSTTFTAFVTDTLRAVHMRSSPYYPQGNAVNEAAHKALAKTLEGAEIGGATSLEETVFAAQLVHNATPHPSVGMSPYAALYGFEPILPGWQELRRDTEASAANIRLCRAQRQALAELLGQPTRALSSDPVKPGDWVVYYLPGVPKAPTGPTAPTDRAVYSSEWSLPCVVVQIANQQATLQRWGDPSSQKKVPLVRLRRLLTEVPASLEPLLVSQIQLSLPTAQVPPAARSRKRPRGATASPTPPIPADQPGSEALDCP